MYFVLGGFLVALALSGFWFFMPMDARILDARFFYSLDDMRKLFELLGPDGRQQYLYNEAFDLIFLSGYSLLLAAGVRALYRKLQIRFDMLALALCFVPGFFDLIETAGIMILLKNWPDLDPRLMQAVQISTPIKWSSGILIVVYTLVGWAKAKSRRGLS